MKKKTQPAPKPRGFYVVPGSKAYFDCVARIAKIVGVDSDDVTGGFALLVINGNQGTNLITHLDEETLRHLPQLLDELAHDVRVKLKQEDRALLGP